MKLLWSVLILTSLVACTQEEDSADIEEAAQQVGDIMASIDESGGSTGSMALFNAESKTYAKKINQLPGAWIERLGQFINPFSSVSAEACSTATTFGACTNNVITRNFGDCTVGLATFSGTVTLTYVDALVNGTCQMTANGHSITRDPNFQVTGRRGATLTVSKTGASGQVITRTAAGVFTFDNDGIRRVFSLNGSDLLDFTTNTTSAIGITGTTRSDRVVNGGTLRVTNNISNVSCDYSPSNVTWSSSCNCATSGSWAGTCSDDTTSNVVITGCGTATATVSGTSQNLTFDRCYSTN